MSGGCLLSTVVIEVMLVIIAVILRCAEKG